jgi:hypothetical protein
MSEKTGRLYIVILTSCGFRVDRVSAGHKVVMDWTEQRAYKDEFQEIPATGS